jgi:hypothetical protein
MMVCADFDGNGTDDLAISDQFTSYVWVVLSTTSGTWGTPVACDLGSTNGQDVYGIDAGDIDRDGDVDLLVAASARDRVCVEINNGSGSFSNGNTYTVDLSPFGVALADFNRDGKLDLAAVSGGQNRVSIRLGNGDGTFGSLSYYATGTNPATAAVGDFNRDGKLDLAVADAGGQEVSVLTGVGDGTFNAKTDYTVGLTPFSVLDADFNRDGILDLGTPDQGSDTVTVLRGLSNGAFTSAVSLSTGTCPQFALAADLNRDGRDDIVSSDYLSDQISVFLTDGTAPVTTDNAPAGWRTVDTTVTLTASDNSSGVERIEYKVDSGSWQTDLTPPTAQVVISAPSNGSNDGVHTITYRATDFVGNIETDKTCTVRIDTTAPSAISGLASSTHPVQANWYSNNTPAFTWSASTDPAPSSGVKGYSYVLDQTSNTTPDTTTETTGLSYTSGTVANGTWYFHIRTVDNAGNGGATTHYTVNVDVSAPSTTDDAPAGWRDTAVTVTLTPSDTASGVASTAYRVDGVGWQSGTSVSISAPSNGSNDATHTIEYYSTDNAGNVESTKNCQVKIDTQTPTTTDNAPSAWQSWSTTVTLTPGDAGNGVSLTEFRIDGGSWLTGTAATVRAWKRGGGVGIHIIEYYSIDTLGHVETTKSCQVKIDNVAPRTTDEAPKSGVPGPVTVTLTPSDAYSGVATTQYRLDFGGWQTGTSVAVSGVGTHRIEYYSTDNVGNDETRHRIVTVSIISGRQVKFEVLHSPLVRDGRR